MLRYPEFLPDRAYWTVVPHLYRLRRYCASEYVNPPIDPFEVTYVDPDRIVRFSEREYPPWQNAWGLFGTTLSGDWDVRDTGPIDSTYDGTDRDLYHANTFSESVLHQSLESHFSRDVPWEETTLINEILERVRDEQIGAPQWNGCTAVSDVWDKCEKIDSLYESIEERGCLSMRELNRKRGYPNRFPETMKREILADVGRDGELLFVNGRHRLSIAKILDLNKIPVAKLVRHTGHIT